MISHIVACSTNNIIGIDGGLPWDLSEDLARFRSMTSNHVVIMGRKTHQSISRVLPNRVNIIITRQVGYKSEDCVIVSSIENALKAAGSDCEVFIIGGGEIYKQSIDIVDTIYMTRINTKLDGDTSYPRVPSDFKIESVENHDGYSYVTFRRRT